MTAEIEDCDLDYTAELTGSVNGNLISLKGRGYINSKDGLTRGEYDLHEIPEDFDPHFLTAVLITGYPNACASLDGIANPFVGASYEYVRELSFRNECLGVLSAQCKLDGRHLRSKFHLSGTFPVASLSSVEPLVETWESDYLGQIKGRFSAAWITPMREQVIAHAESTYSIARPVSEAIQLMHRFIEIKSVLRGMRLSLTQHSFTFRRLTKSNMVIPAEQ